ncbi:unnamed protein product [Rotaria socialis]|uniref:Tc1-like transposase DDE domain-containing protein n=1 Tax=Rotaria socialis TaxID=392032 RepID=A0A820ZCF8_9BILA|nr:unnamed protein product [Rotaria socialis]CAF4560409.1 unnamed protein product [Rotaria socialis]
MPRKSNKVSKALNAAVNRWKLKVDLKQQDASSSSSSLSSSPSLNVEMGSIVDLDYDETKDESEGEGGNKNSKLKIELPIIGDLFEICKSACGSRNLSVLIYTILRYLNITWRDTDGLLKNIGAYRCENAHKRAEIFISGDIEVFQEEGREGKYHETFYDMFPELEADAKLFAIESCSHKSADFTAIDLANFIDEKFYELTQTSKLDDALVRSVESCRLDLRRWGAKFQPNTQRPYFEGHESQDVITHRQEFISYFLQRKDLYYTITDGDQPVWKIPSHNPSILIFHDESTFKSGEMSAKRWTVEGHTPFFSKGRGRSYMISDFIVQHPSGPFFSLSDAEYGKAVKKFPSLSSDDDVLIYIRNSATAGINVGIEGYFDNGTILSQFERFFQLISFKQDFKGHDIVVVVDNARTHSAREYSINEFSKGIGTKCPADSIDYVDHTGKLVSISCSFTTGEYRGKTKGLLQLAKELKVPVRHSINLVELRALLAQHPAFQNVSKLEILGKKYNIKVIFCPKFHCELNAIEGLWCHMKQYVRKKSDQTFPTMLRLISESRDNFKERKIHMKLFRRFWRSIDAYSQGKSYAEVLSLFFGQACKSDVVSHRKITNSKLK